MRSDIERTRKAEKRERKNRARVMEERKEKEGKDRAAAMEIKRSRARHEEEGKNNTTAGNSVNSKEGSNANTSESIDSTQTTGKSGKKTKGNNKKLPSKSQVKRKARREQQINSDPELEGSDKYRIGELNSRRRHTHSNRGLKELMDEEEGMHEREIDTTEVENSKNEEEDHPFWSTPPK